ncbi:hypothetical protein [Aminobacter sp. BE322]|uniref:hypothetical protein n=1 Tax=unclassified Aminobacter TaxID=2644704 RepID=UPI003D1A22CF
MPYLDIYLSQLIDPFRIGLLIALVLTAANTARQINRWIPIALGIVFVAVLIPYSIGADASDGPAAPILVGLASNATILAVLFAAKAAYARLG